MQLAIALSSHCSAELSGAVLLSRLSHLCDTILQPPVSSLARHSQPFLLVQPYTSRHHKHTQRRQMRHCIAATTSQPDTTAPHSKASQLGIRRVEECVRWLSDREGEGRQEMAAVLCEARVWLSYIVQAQLSAHAIHQQR